MYSSDTVSGNPFPREQNYSFRSSSESASPYTQQCFLPSSQAEAIRIRGDRALPNTSLRKTITPAR